jgi:hypothetical protein
MSPHPPPPWPGRFPGELIKIHLTNKLEIPCGTRPERVFPQVPLDLSDCREPEGLACDCPECFDRNEEKLDCTVMSDGLEFYRETFDTCPGRVVSQGVSFHCEKLSYNVSDSDGVQVGRNNGEQFVRPGQTRTYTFLADKVYGFMGQLP